MDRTVTVGVASGSISSVLLGLLHRAVVANPEILVPGCAAGVLDLDFFRGWHIPSILLGIFIGICAGPLLDLVWLLRHRWRRFIFLQSLGWDHSGKQLALQGPCMSSGSGHCNAEVLAEIRELRAEIQKLRARVEELELRDLNPKSG